MRYRTCSQENSLLIACRRAVCLAVICFTAACLVAKAPITAFAAAPNQDKKPITKVELTFTSSLQIGERGGSVRADSTSPFFTVQDTVLQNDVDVWSERDMPEVRVYLKADDDCYFQSTGKHSFSLLGEEAAYLSAELREDASVLVLNVRLRTLDSTGQAHWQHDNIGGWWYCYPDGTCPVNTWQNIEDIWYFFDENGYMKTGWILWEEKWYYCNAETGGGMMTNARTPDGYYVGASGAWIKGR